MRQSESDINEAHEKKPYNSRKVSEILQFSVLKPEAFYNNVNDENPKDQ